MKKAWIDVETGGLDAKTHALLQVAIIIEIDNEIVGTFESFIKPPDNLTIDADALAINGLTFREIDMFVPEAKAYKDMVTFLNKFVDRFDKEDKLIFSGYNSRFDLDFIHELFKRNNNKYFAAYFSFYDNDTFALVKLLVHLGRIKDFENLQLGTMCAKFKIIIEHAHDAISDIKATRKLHKKLVKKFLK